MGGKPSWCISLFISLLHTVSYAAWKSINRWCIFIFYSQHFSNILVIVKIWAACDLLLWKAPGYSPIFSSAHGINFHHHHHVPEVLGMFSVPWSSGWCWSLHLFFDCPMFHRPFGLYCSACFGSLFVFILCTCCSHIFW